MIREKRKRTINVDIFLLSQSAKPHSLGDKVPKETHPELGFFSQDVLRKIRLRSGIEPAVNVRLFRPVGFVVVAVEFMESLELWLGEAS